MNIDDSTDWVVPQNPDASSLVGCLLQSVGRLFKGQMQLWLKGRSVYCVAMEHETNAGQSRNLLLEGPFSPPRLPVRLDGSRAELSPGSQDPMHVPRLRFPRVSHKDESGLPITTKLCDASDQSHQTATSTSTPIRSRLSSNQHESHTHLQRVARCIHVAVGGGGWC